MLIVVAIALLKCIESDILDSEYEGCLQLLSRLPENALGLKSLASENRLVKFAVKYWNFLEKEDHSKYMDRLSEEYSTKHKEPTHALYKNAANNKINRP